MAHLRPFPFAGLLTRMFREHAERGSIFDLPEKKFFRGPADGRDLGVRFHGRRAATPLGPAAGPQTQLAQNIVLAWLGGCRILELKTVQILDELEIPRPCIDMETIGFNVEWSQELKLEQSLEEYVKGAMLIEILRASDLIELPPEAADTIYDMSVGYDLAGIRHPRVQAFIDGMRDCRALVDRLRAEIPDELARFRDLPFPERLADTLTLSTFHGCPPDEIEGIIDFLLREKGLHCVIKLNPTLLGPDAVHEILAGELGYDELRVPQDAFEKDTRWDQMVGFVTRLKETADGLGLGLGVKFTNTLIVENHRDFFPASEKEMYLSGAPLHVLAMQLVARLREHFGERIPISFSAGIDRQNFPDAVALGLVPITVCSDLLRPGGYGRAITYLQELEKRMAALGARTIDEYRAAADLSAVDHAAEVRRDPRYVAAGNRKTPPKIGSHLELFDCVTCDKCIPVCPNHANFSFAVPPQEIRKLRAVPGPDGLQLEPHGVLAIEQRHQIGNLVDFCNECGNCDVFCPEDGGPYVIKARFFTARSTFDADPGDGFHLERRPDGRVHAAGRFRGTVYEADLGPAPVRYQGDGFDLTLDPAAPETSIGGSARGPVDLTYLWILDLVQRHALDPRHTTYLTV